MNDDDDDDEEDEDGSRSSSLKYITIHDYTYIQRCVYLLTVHYLLLAFY